MNPPIKMLKRISVVLLMLTPIPSGKIIIFSGLAMIFQFLNLTFLLLTSEFQESYLREFTLAIVYIISILLMIQKRNRLFIIGFILNISFWILILKQNSFKTIEFIIPFLLSIIVSIYTSIRILKEK
ncbi:hypothetical protein [Bizionia sp.]|uniref:hypothetical protein n=1 Tax=Bizionia sp. TaxID=1954480 RepID=UPI003A94B587